MILGKGVVMSKLWYLSMGMLVMAHTCYSMRMRTTHMVTQQRCVPKMRHFSQCHNHINQELLRGQTVEGLKKGGFFCSPLRIKLAVLAPSLVAAPFWDYWAQNCSTIDHFPTEFITHVFGYFIIASGLSYGGINVIGEIAKLKRLQCEKTAAKEELREFCQLSEEAAEELARSAILHPRSLLARRAFERILQANTIEQEKIQMVSNTFFNQSCDGLESYYRQWWEQSKKNLMYCYPNITEELADTIIALSLKRKDTYFSEAKFQEFLKLYNVTLD